MPHQDTGSVNGSAYNHQALKQALQWLLEGVSWARVLFRVDCTWAPQLLAITAMLWAWSDEKTLKGRFLTARKIARRMFPSRKAPAGSYQAFIKLLRKWTTALVAAVQTLFRQHMRQRLAGRFTLAGFSPFGVDGSRFGLPRTASHERAFAPSKQRKKARWKKAKKAQRKAKQPQRLTKEQKATRARAKKADTPQMWVTVLWHLGCGLPWSWRFGPSDSSEREHMRQMIGELPPAALLVADAGFPGYTLWRALVVAGCQMVMRVGSNVHLLRRLGYVKERGDVVYLWPDRVAAKSQPPIVLRLVVIHNGRHPVYLVTTVLDHRRLSDQQVIEFYRLRWGIELFYRHEANLRASQTPQPCGRERAGGGRVGVGRHVGHGLLRAVSLATARHPAVEDQRRPGAARLPHAHACLQESPRPWRRPARAARHRYHRFVPPRVESQPRLPQEETGNPRRPATDRLGHNHPGAKSS
jgi:hypothetical protein